MKNRKFALLLALVMVACVLLPGCGEKAPAETKAPVQTAAPVETTVPVETTAPAEERNLSLGVIEGTTYTNRYAGLEIRLDDSWTIYPAEQLQELPDILKDMAEGTDMEQALEGVQQITDVLAENADELTTINLVMQKLSTQERIVYKLMDEEALVDTLLSQKDSMITVYAQGGINVSSMDKVTVTYMGQEHLALKTVAETQGVPYYILQLFDFDLGAYSVTITLGSFVEDKTESLLDLLHALD